MEKIVQKPLKASYYVSQALKAFKGFFIILLIMKIMDFASDITLMFKYSRWDLDDYDLPTEEECTELRKNPLNDTIACYFHDMKFHSSTMLFLMCLIIFVLTYTLESVFLIWNEKSFHYFATSFGYCCWNSFKTSRMKMNLCDRFFTFLRFIFIFLLNDIWTTIYGMKIEIFVDYWRPSEKQRPNNEGKI